MGVARPPLVVVVHAGRAGRVCAQAVVARDGAADAGARSHLVAAAELGDAQWELLAEADGILFGTTLPQALGRGDWLGKPAAGFVAPGADARERLDELAAFAEGLGMCWIGPAGPPGRFAGPGPDPVLDAVRRLGSRMARMARLAGAAPVGAPGGVS
ncbi:hypothetical protein ACIQWR_16695 [Streptomyces sp. NPDC098789]|uniref:hypothetical protein n=1 Tax=Streptomyces sp. NPDC098789 TaxID=3366098 RepID=UPI003804775A